MGAPKNAYTPYAEQHKNITGPGDARPTAIQVVQDCKANLKGKTVLITGCSSGIGVETARALYEAGATLFLQARDMPKLEKVIDDIATNAQTNKDGPRPQGIEIHLDSLDSVRKGAEDFKAKSGNTLNILINNAGVMAAPYGTTQDGLETQLGVNHFAHFLLFALLKDTLIATAQASGTTSRVINVSSYGHTFGPVKANTKSALDSWNKGEGFDKWASYGQAKTANIWMANEISRRYRAQGIEGLSLHPGGILTELGRHIDIAEIEAMGDAVMRTLKSPAQGAATTVWAAVSPHFDDAANGGRYLSDVGEAVPMYEGAEMGGPVYAPHAYDPEGEKALWEVSCAVTGVKDE